MRCRLRAEPAQGEGGRAPQACPFAPYLSPGTLAQTGETTSAGGPQVHLGHRAYFEPGREGPSAHQFRGKDPRGFVLNRAFLRPRHGELQVTQLPSRNHAALHIRLGGPCGSPDPAPLPRAPRSWLAGQ